MSPAEWAASQGTGAGEGRQTGGPPNLLPGPNFLCLPPLYLFQCTCTWKPRQYLGLLCRSKTEVRRQSRGPECHRM